MFKTVEIRMKQAKKNRELIKQTAPGIFKEVFEDSNFEKRFFKKDER